MLIISLTLLLFIATTTSGDATTMMVEKREVDASWRQELRLKDVTANGWPYPYAVNKTNVRCCNNTACNQALGGGLWCKSGVVCIATYCYVIPNYPCATQVESCDEKNHKCITHTCKANSDCDDNIFCNGQEQCVRGICIPGSSSQCHGGMCDEVNKKCSYPNIFSQWLLYAQSLQSAVGLSSKASIIGVNNFNSTGSGFPDTWTIWVIICVAAIIFVVVALVLISMMSRGPSVIGPIDGGAFTY